MLNGLASSSPEQRRQVALIPELEESSEGVEMKNIAGEGEGEVPSPHSTIGSSHVGSSHGMEIVNSGAGAVSEMKQPYNYETTFRSFLDPEEARAHHFYYTLGPRRSKRPTFTQMEGVHERKPTESNKVKEYVENDSNDDKKSVKRFGTWDGVFTSCLLNIFGVIMFLRVGWIVGQAGIGLGLLIIWLSTIVVLTTALSMSAICTNGQIEAGGAYYLISRSLGPAIGGAIGVIFAIGNSVAVALYVIGFMETLVEQLGSGYSLTGDSINDIRVYGIVLVTILLLIALVGVGWVLKVQFVLLLLLVGAIICFLIGTGVSEKPEFGVLGYGHGLAAENAGPEFVPLNSVPTDFRVAFGIFFPAVTGIMAGANISGDLKNPSEAIPKGTLSAVGISSITYSVMAILIGCVCVRDVGGEWGLHHDLLIMARVSVWDGIIFAGIYAATFSSALASLVGAPRILMSVAQDDVLPFLAPFKKTNKKGDPVRAYLVTYVIGCACVLIGSLNQIAPLITMFFMLTYALINLACFMMSISKSPGWRPTFKYYSKWTALLGFFMCYGMMFVLNYIYAIVASFVAATLYLYIDRKGTTINWGSGMHGRKLFAAIKAMLDLHKTSFHIKNFRPNYLVMSGDPTKRTNLINFMHTLHKGYGCVFLADVVVGEFNVDNYTKVLENHFDYDGYYVTPSQVAGPSHVRMFYDRVVAPTLRIGMQSLLQTVGVGRLRANTCVLGYKTSWQKASDKEVDEYVALIRDTFLAQMGVMLLRNIPTIRFNKDPDPFGTIDVWWLLDDGGLTILIPQIMARAEFWKTHTDGTDGRVRLFLVSDSDHSHEDLSRVSNLLKKFRINWSTPEVLVIGEEPPSDEAMAHYDNTIAPSNKTQNQLRPEVTKRWVKVSELMKEHSRNARIAFCTMPYPRVNVASRDYMSWLEVLSEDMPPIVLMRGSGENVLTWYSE